MDVLSIWESAGFLAYHLPQKSQRAWFAYLKKKSESLEGSGWGKNQLATHK